MTCKLFLSLALIATVKAFIPKTTRISHIASLYSNLKTRRSFTSLYLKKQQPTQEDFDLAEKKLIWARVKESEKRRGNVFIAIVLLIGLRLFFTPLEIRAMRVCGHDYDVEVFKCTPQKQAIPMILEAIKGPIVLPSDAAWGGVPDVFGGEEYIKSN